MRNPDELEAEILRIVSNIVHLNGGMAVAKALGMSESHLSYSLNRRKNAALRIERCGPLFPLRGGAELARLFAELAGGHFVESTPLSPEEELSALKQLLPEFLGTEPRKDLLRATRQRGIENRGVRLRLVVGGEREK